MEPLPERLRRKGPRRALNSLPGLAPGGKDRRREDASAYQPGPDGHLYPCTSGRRASFRGYFGDDDPATVRAVLSDLFDLARAIRDFPKDHPAFVRARDILPRNPA